jgi:membrane-associated phospholipid phosphatase
VCNPGPYLLARQWLDEEGSSEMKRSVALGVAATVLASFFGDRDRLRVTSEVVPGAVRTFRSYAAVATEAGLSRIYAGVHTRLDHRAGAVLGKRVATFVLRQSLSRRFGPSPRG